MYTCSEDKHIAEWCVKTHQVRSKWKADKRAVKRLCMSPSGTSLLSAGSSIKLWNLETKELLQQFNGHSSPISMLQFSPFKQNIEDSKVDDGYYFISGSTKDRVINAWQINSKKTERAAIASFVTSDVPVFMDIILDTDSDQPLNLCVGCQDGRIHFFTCTMNGHTLKPITSSKTVDYLQKEGASSVSLPLVNGRLYKNKDVKLSLVYGQVLNISFSDLCYNELAVTSTIYKDIKKNLLLTDNVKGNDKPVTIASTKRSKFISDTSSAVHPTVVRTSLKAIVPINGVEKDKLDDLSMEERMKASLNPKEFVVKMKPSKDAPNAASFAQLLIQALHSKDDKLINEMIFKNHFTSKVLMNTIKRIPNNLIEQLLRTISDMLLWNPSRSSYLIMWLRTIMSVHLTFLLTSEISRDALSGIYRLVKAQEEIHMPLLNLRGKIDMVFSYVSGNGDSGDEDNVPIETVTYDDSGDDTDETLNKSKKSEKSIKEVTDSDATDEEDALKLDNDYENNETDNETDIETDNKIEHPDHESEDEG